MEILKQVQILCTEFKKTFTDIRFVLSFSAIISTILRPLYFSKMILPKVYTVLFILLGLSLMVTYIFIIQRMFKTKEIFLAFTFFTAWRSWSQRDHKKTETYQTFCECDERLTMQHFKSMCKRLNFLFPSKLFLLIRTFNISFFLTSK